MEFDLILHNGLAASPGWGLIGAFVVSIAILGKGADWLVGGAVALSSRMGVPKFVIGTTIVSLGTTLPECFVSVLAAAKGSPGLALGNAVGSIICDTGLILGICCFLGNLPVRSASISRATRIQLGAGFLLIVAASPWPTPWTAFATGGRLSQLSGIGFLGLLVWYIWTTIVRSRREAVDIPPFDEEGAERSTMTIVLTMLGAAIVVLLSSEFLIATATEGAHRLGVPESVIAATLVAFGTSFPELVTAVVATLRNHGELAVGNVVGADILNVFFVAGAAAAITPAGLFADVHFFTYLFPVMAGVLIIFKVGTKISRGGILRAPFGALLLIVYLCGIGLSYKDSF